MSALFNIFDNEKNEYMTKKVRLSVKDYSCYDLNIKRLQIISGNCEEGEEAFY